LDARADRHLADRRLHSFQARYRAAGKTATNDALFVQAIFQVNHPSARAGRWENKTTSLVSTITVCFEVMANYMQSLMLACFLPITSM
jgi:hypothetical protein